LNQAEKDSIDFQLLKAGRIKRNFYPKSDNYLKFMVNELKPYIDKNYSVREAAESINVSHSAMDKWIR
jgi:predicted alpha/beta superfamily hydrolase